jgi:hypothetical protein
MSAKPQITDIRATNKNVETENDLDVPIEFIENSSARIPMPAR